MTAVFPSGIAAGDPSPTSVVLWTRIASDVNAQWANWAIAEPDGRVVKSGKCQSEGDSDGTIHVLADGLAPGRSYRYWFEQRGQRTETGSFRTLRDDGVIRFAVACCAKYNSGYFNAYEHIANLDDLDFVLHLGDYIYEAAEVPPQSQTPGREIGRPFNPRWECKTLADYRVRYAQYRADPQVRSMHQNHPLVATLDDHELADNAWRGGAEEHDEERDGPWSTRLQQALQAWEEWTPTMRRPATRGDKVWRAVPLGKTGALAVLETRTERIPSGRGPSPRLIDPMQRAWLEDLAQTTPGLLMIGSPSTVTPLYDDDLAPPTRQAMTKLKLLDPSSGTRPFYDLWDAFPDDRRWLHELVTSRAPRPSLLLSGDVHVSFDATFAKVGDSLRIPEWTCPSTTSQNLDDKMGWHRHGPSREHEATFLSDHPQFDYCDFDSHGHLVVEVSDRDVTCEWWMVDSVTEPDPACKVEYRAKLLLPRE